MKLTAEQREQRRKTIGASEVSALVGSNPYRTRVDVWLEKTGRAEPEPETLEAPAFVGHGLEGAIVEMYTARTGRRAVRQSVTNTHPEFEHVSASPDAFVDDPVIAGAEIKVIGFRMQHHWYDDALPDYVVDQAQQNMLVHGADAWDVVALIGTELRIRTLYADLEYQLALAEAAELFWFEHVVPDIPPETEDPDERRAMLRARYPGSEATATRNIEADLHAGQIAALVKEHAELAEAEKAAKKRRDEVTNALCQFVGDDYGISAGWGKFLWYPCRGRVDWEAVAAEAALPQELIEKHRGKPTRVPRLYPFTPKRPTTKKTRTKR